MQTKTYNAYTFDELSDEAKEKAVDNLRDINVSYEWWDDTYYDAKEVGLEIKSFDLDRNRHATGKFIDGIENVARLIIENHGAHCETHKTALSYQQDRDALVSKLSDGKNTSEVSEDKLYEFDNECDELDEQFLKDLLENYSIVLQNEFDYLTTDEAIIEIILANDYQFTEDVKID